MSVPSSSNNPHQFSSTMTADEQYHSAGEDVIQTATMEKFYDGGNGKAVDVLGMTDGDHEYHSGDVKRKLGGPYMGDVSPLSASPMDFRDKKHGKVTEDLEDGVLDRSVSVEQIEHVEKVTPLPAKPLTGKQKIKKHWKRFWCCYILGGIIFLAIFLPVFFLKIVPAIAQLIVNKTALPIDGGAIKAYSPTELEISLLSSLNIPAGFTVNLDDITLYLFNRNTTNWSPYTDVTIPGMTVKGYTPVDIENTIATVTNETELVVFLNNVFNSKSTILSARGSGTAHLGALKADVTLDKDVEIAALNKLSGFGLDTVKLILPPEADGTNIAGNLTLPNWSALTLGMGNVTLNAMAGKNLIIGQISIDNVLVAPGNNSLAFRGQLYLSTIIANLGQVILANANALKTGSIAIGASGNSTVVNGQHIGYLEKVLNNIYLEAEIPIITLLGDVISSFTGGNSSITGLLGAVVQALNSSGLLAELQPYLSKLNLTQVESIYKREVLGEFD